MKIIHQPWWQRLWVQPERSQPHEEEDQGEPQLQVFKICQNWFLLFVILQLTINEIDIVF